MGYGSFYNKTKYIGKRNNRLENLVGYNIYQHWYIEMVIVLVAEKSNIYRTLKSNIRYNEH